MIETNQIYIPIPKAKNTQISLLINDQEMKQRCLKSNFVKPVTNGIGTFNLTLNNSFGQLNGLFSEGQTVKFYADNQDATTLQFWGRIDYIKNNISDSGQFLEIEGRHRSYLLTEYLVCHSTNNKDPAQILKDIIDKAGGFTYVNVDSTSELMSVQWEYKTFWDCVIELCKYAGYDCYVDDDLDFHFFEANSIMNDQEAIVEGDNFLKTQDWGTNNTYEKTRVTVIGQDDEGIPIIYTAKIDNETDIREVFIRESSANTEEKVKNLAEAKLGEYTNRNPQATITSYGLETLNPGDNFWVMIPRQQIAGIYKTVQITHKFGAEVGGWRTENVIEEEENSTSFFIQKALKQTQSISNPQNINKMNYSYNFSFDNDTGTHSNTEIIEGILKTDGSASGTWISPLKTMDENATGYELRVKGESIPGTNFYVSSDGGNTWQGITSQNTLYNFSPPGKNLKIKVEFNSASTQIKSLALLYS